MRRKKAG